MSERWIAEAEQLTPAGTPGRMEGGTPRVTLHVTVSKPGSFDAMDGVLTRNRSEPHILYDPATDRLGQYFPLDVSARALQNDGTRRTNGHGTVNIQVEVCAMPTGFTTGWKPGPNWLTMLRAIRSWGVPDVWPAGRLSRTGSDNVDRSWASYAKAGWFGHCNVPGNTHWDPGPINQAAVFGPKEDDMQLSDKVTVTQIDGSGTEEISLAVFFNRLHWVYSETIRQKAKLDQLVAADAAQTAALKALAANPSLDLNKVTQAAQAGAAAALDARIQTATVQLEVTP